MLVSFSYINNLFLRKSMTLSLEGITADNYEAICDLEVAKTQEEYVACNMWSLVEAHYNSGYTCKAN